MPRKAKQKDEDMNTEATGTETEAETAEAPAATTDSRFIMIEDPETGEQVKRVDWIREQFQKEGGAFYGNRGAIAKKLTEIQGKPVAYQIVFAATKDLKHIKKPEAQTEGEAEPEAEAETGE